MQVAVSAAIAEGSSFKIARDIARRLSPLYDTMYPQVSSTSLMLSFHDLPMTCTCYRILFLSRVAARADHEMLLDS